MDIQKLGLIAGNGQFPFLVLKEARKRGIDVVVAAIKEETFPEIEQAAGAESAGKAAAQVHWLGLGQLGKLIRVFKKAGVERAVMAGQVRHVQIFGSAKPDLKMMRVLMSLPRRNTDALIGGVARALEEEGIQLVSSIFLLGPLLASAGVLTHRQPSRTEMKDIEYGRRVAREIARLDLGQTIVVKNQAVVAIEAMEGTDETIRRAARLVNGQRLTVVKVSKPNQDMRFDVPVVGLQTLDVLAQCGVSAMAIDAGTTLVLDRQEFIKKADRMKIAILAG